MNTDANIADSKTSTKMIAAWKERQRDEINRISRKLATMDMFTSLNSNQVNAVRLAAKSSLNMDFEGDDFDVDNIVMPQAALYALVTHAKLTSEEDADNLFEGDDGTLTFIQHELCWEI